MNIKEIKEMIKIMTENDITEFEMERDGFRVHLKRGSADTVPIIQQLPMAKNELSITPAATKAEKELEAPPEDIEEIVAPMVGTFYSAPTPESKPFVKKGQKINSGDVVCIVEAMKVMNEIKSQVTGVIEEILVENSESVEYGQPLFKVKRQ